MRQHCISISNSKIIEIAAVIVPYLTLHYEDHEIEDYIHPSEKGHKLISEKLYDFLLRNEYVR